MTTKSTETRRRHPGWVKVKFAITFLVKGMPDKENILNDMALALDPGGEEDNIFEPLVKDDVRITIQAAWAVNPKSVRGDISPLAKLFRKFPGATPADMSVVMVYWAFPTSKATSENEDTLLRMATDFLASRETESNYLMHGWILKFTGVAEL